MSGTNEMWAFFDRDTTTAHGVTELRKSDTKFDLYAPYMTHTLEHAMAPRTSPVRLFVLLGGLIGTIAGFSLTIWTATRWGLIVGGKPVVAIPPYVVIAFELTLLFGSLAAASGLFLLGGMPKWRSSPGYDPSLSADRFALRVGGNPEQLEVARNVLQGAGAVEFRVSSGDAGSQQSEVQHA